MCKMHYLNIDFETDTVGCDKIHSNTIKFCADKVREIQKAKAAYQWCTDTGIVDDVSEEFPMTSSGTCDVRSLMYI